MSKRTNLRLFDAISARGAAVASVLHQIRGDTTRLLAVVEEGPGRILELDVLQAMSRAHFASLLRP